MKAYTSYFSLCFDKILDKKQFKRGRVDFGLQLGKCSPSWEGEGEGAGHTVSPAREHGVMNTNTQFPFSSSPTFRLSFPTLLT